RAAAPLALHDALPICAPPSRRKMAVQQARIPRLSTRVYDPIYPRGRSCALNRKRNSHRNICDQGLFVRLTRAAVMLDTVAHGCKDRKSTRLNYSYQII